MHEFGVSESGEIAGLLEQASSSAFAEYNPEHVIHAVNALVPLGKDDALDSVDAYLRSADRVTELVEQAAAGALRQRTPRLESEVTATERGHLDR